MHVSPYSRIPTAVFPAVIPLRRPMNNRNLRLVITKKRLTYRLVIRMIKVRSYILFFLEEAQ